jgi:nucleoside recognition membrane protein YjiH
MQIVINLTSNNIINNSKNSLNSSLEDTKQFIDLTSSITCIFLSFFCLITVFGNGLVIYAVIQERYLKSGLF